MDRNNVLDWEECKEFVAEVMKPLGGYDIKAFKKTYDQMDRNNDGKLDKNELIDKVLEVYLSKAGANASTTGEDAAMTGVMNALG